MPPMTFCALPVEILHHVCDILFAQPDTSSLLNLMRTSPQLYDVVSPIIYDSVGLNSRNIRGFLRGLDPACTDKIRLPPVSILHRPDPTDSLYHASSASEARKVLLLGLVGHVDISEGLSEDRCPRDIVAHHGILQFRVQRVSILDWVLACATTYNVQLLPSLRQITYHERYVPTPVNAFERGDYYRQLQSRDIVQTLTIRLEPTKGYTSSDGRKPTLKLHRQWDICVWTAASDYSAFPHRSWGGQTLHSWLINLTTGSNTSIHNLAVHSDDQHLLQGLSLLDLAGTLRLYIRQPAKAIDENIVRVDLPGVGGPDTITGGYTTVVSDLLRSAWHDTQHEARLEVYHAFEFDKGDTGVLRDKVFAALRKLPNLGRLRVEKDESGGWLLSNPFAKDQRREVWLVGLDVQESRCACKAMGRGGGAGHGRLSNF